MKRKLLIKTAMALALLLGAVGVQADLPQGQVKSSLQGQTSKRQSGEQVARHSSRFVQSSADQKEEKKRPARVLELRADAAESPTLIGYAYAGSTAGMYSIPFDGSTSCTLLKESGLSAVKNAVLAGNTYYTTTSTGMAYNPTIMHQEWSIDTWTSTEYSGAKGQLPLASCYNSADGKIYGFWMNNSYDYEFKTIKYGASTEVTDIVTVTSAQFGGSDVCAMAAAANGTMYVFCKNGKLYSIDASGSYTLIGNTTKSTTVTGSAGAAIHPTTGKLYYAVYTGGSSKLFDVDMTTATATEVATFDTKYQFVGLGFTGGGGGTTPQPTLAEPAAVTDLAVNFPAGSMNGTVTFTMPTTDVNGTHATGPCNYTIELGGRTFDGTSEYGAPVSKDVYVDDFDSYTCTVYARNGAGQGVSATADVVVTAPVAPGAVTKLAANFPDGSLEGTISFEMPTVMADGSPAPTGEPVMFQISFSDQAASPAGDMSTYGTPVSVPVTVSAFGTYTVTVTAMNQGGPGAAAELEFTVRDKVAISGPGAATNLKAEYTDGNLVGKLSFDMPATYDNGNTPPAGTVINYLAKLYDSAGAQVDMFMGMKEFGGHVDLDYTLPAFGTYKFEVETVDYENELPGQKASINFTVNDAATPAVPTSAPAKPTDFAVVFDNGLQGKATFTVPTTLRDGSTWTEGKVTYDVYISEGHWSGEAAYGEAVTVDVSVPETNDYMCFLMLTNEAGESDQAMLMNIHAEGPTTPPTPTDPVAPGAVTNLTTSFTDGSLEGTISFDMPTTLADGTTPAADVQVFYNIQINGMDPIIFPSTYGAHVDQSVTLPAYGTYTASVTAVDMENEVYSATVTSEEFTVNEGTVTPPTPASSYTLVGYVMNKKAGWDKALYTIPTDGSAELTLKKALETEKDVMQAFTANGTYYTTYKKMVNYVTTYFHVPFSTVTWNPLGEAVVGDKSQLAKAVTYCNGKLYGIFAYNYTLSFCTLDIADGASTLTPIAEGGEYENFTAVAMATGLDGTIYVFCKDGKLKKVNPADGVLTDIGDMGLPVVKESSAAVDPATGTIYYAPFEGETTSLYTIDPATAAATKVTTFTGIPQLVGMTFLPEPAAAAPTKPTDFAVVFDNGLEGKATFTVPTTLADGSTRTEGSVEYQVMIAEGSWKGMASYGEAVTVPVSVTETNDYSCFVMLTNEAGVSDQAMLTGVHAEKPVVAPDAVTNLTTSFAEGSLEGTISFDMPTTLADGTTPAADAQVFYNIQINGMDPIVAPAAYGAHVEQKVLLPDYGTYTASVTIVDMENEIYSATVTSEEFTVTEPAVTPTEPAKLVGYFVSPTGSAPGVYSIPTDGTTASTLIKALVPDVSNGVLAGDKYYVTTQAGNYYDGWNITFKGYNALTWDIITDVKDESESPNQHVPYAATYCPTDGKIYAITIDGDYYNVFGTLDYATGTMTPIKRHNSSNQSQDFYAMAAGTDGTIYAFRGNGTMYTVDKTTGEMTEVGSTGLSFGGKGSAVVDPATGVMYLTNNNELYTIDKTNCTATKIATFENSGRILGLAMLSSEAPDPVPSPVENLAVNFEGESLSGTVTFTTPATLVDGTAGEGTLTYEVKANGSLLASAVTGFGQEVTANVTLPESGEYEFAVTVYNEAGSSEAVKLTQRVGNIPLSGIIPPYLNTFDNTSSAEGFTMLNLNGDGLEWQFDANGGYWMGYNMQQDMNAWIISPAVNLEAGKVYDISIVASVGNSAYPERAAIWLGTEANPDMMVIPVVEPTKITSPVGIGQTLKGMVTVNTTGQYYVGIHGCSDKDKYKLFIDDLSISAPKPSTLPGAVTDFTVTNPAKDLNVTISLKAPSVDFAGNALTTIDKIELSRGGELIKTFETPAPGAVLTYTDVVPTNGNYTYTAVASNADGVGPELSVREYIGTPMPASPTNAVIKETSNEGEVTITWEAPATDKEGRPIDPSIITYDIINTQNPNVGAVVENLATTTYTFRAVQAGMQDMVQYAVFAKTSSGYAELPATTELYPVGKAYEMPVSESFPNGDVANEYIWGNAAYPGYSTWWEMCTVDNGLVPQDNDNGYLSSFGPAVGDKAVLYFSKIAVGADAVNPVLSYWYYKASDGNNTIEARVDAGNGVESLQTVVCGPEAEGWKRAIVPLDNYKGKDIRLSLVTTVGDYYQATPIDNISVFDYPDKNLTLAALDVHSSVKAGEDLVLTVKVSNTGRLAVNAYSVELFCDGQSYETKECTAIDPDAVSSVQFSVPTGMASANTLSFKAVINYAEDMNTDDNSSKTVDVTVIFPTYPVPTDLAAEYSGENVTLTWTAPEVSEDGMPMSKTESFEEYESFAINPEGDWTFYDEDGSGTWAFADVMLPEDGASMAYIVYDHSQAPSQMLLTDAHTGDKQMMCIAAKGTANDDWMVSPELYGCAQNVSFYARAVQPAYSEVFEVYYSTTGKEINDFSVIKRETPVPGEWTKYQYKLPEGAKYFAIRCISDNCMGFSVDDVEFIPVGAETGGLEVLGYNVYRDGVKINTELVAETTYNDVTTVTTETEYFVTAVYEPGESAASNKVKPTSGIGSAYNGDITITAGRGTITVTGAVDTNVAVYTTAGYALYNEQGAETTIIRTEPGVYIVKAGTRTAKVVVK